MKVEILTFSFCVFKFDDSHDDDLYIIFIFCIKMLHLTAQSHHPAIALSANCMLTKKILRSLFYIFWACL